MNFILYKETNFKETRIGKIPSEWEIKKLAEVINYVKGRKPKKLHDRKVSETLLPYLTAEYMRGLEEPKWCNPLEDQKLVRVEEGDVIMIWDGSYAGHVFTGFNGILASTMIRIVPNQEVNGKFLYYFLTKNFQVFRGTTAGTGIPHVSKKVFDELPVPIPSVKEQQKIAEILSIVDEAILKTNEIIAKTERLKKGLMQELLTKGIGHKEFKDTEIGRIPKDWEVVKLGDVITYRKGIKPKAVFDRREPNTLPYLTADDVRAGIFTKWARESDKTIKVNKDDIILIWDGFYCGDAFIGLEGILSSTMIKIEPKSNLNGRFLFYVLKTHFKELNTKISGMYLKHVNKSVFENLKLPLPPLQEQQKIAEILSTVDKKLEIERNDKAKLERIKRGLMDLLLTGKIRVKVNSNG
jgi:type I restriction enzyme S subunit